MPVNYDRAVSRASVFDRARNRDFEFDGMSPINRSKIQRYCLSDGNIKLNSRNENSVAFECWNFL